MNLQFETMWPLNTGIIMKQMPSMKVCEFTNKFTNKLLLVAHTSIKSVSF